MAHQKLMQISLINLKIHPHAPNLYANMLQTVYSKKIVRQIRGADNGMIGSFYKDMYEAHGILYGSFYKFLDINPKGKWLDINGFKKIDPEDTGKLPVPENLKPNLKEIGYVFYPGKHRLAFESKDISPNSILSLCRNLFSEKSIMEEFGQVDISLEATDQVIKQILSIPRITNLSINFTRPNNDDTTGHRDAIQKRIEAQNLRSLKQTLTTTDKEGILPDEETKALMEIARSNGHVTATGYAGKKKIEYSTTRHPIKKRMKYDPEIQTQTSAMIELSNNLIEKI